MYADSSRAWQYSQAQHQELHHHHHQPQPAQHQQRQQPQLQHSQQQHHQQSMPSSMMGAAGQNDFVDRQRQPPQCHRQYEQRQQHPHHQHSQHQQYQQHQQHQQLQHQPPQQHQQHQQLQHQPPSQPAHPQYPQHGQPQYAATVRPPVQSGWFPLQDVMNPDEPGYPEPMPPSSASNRQSMTWGQESEGYPPHRPRPENPMGYAAYPGDGAGGGTYPPSGPHGTAAVAYHWKDDIERAVPMHSTHMEYAHGIPHTMISSVSRHEGMNAFASPQKKRHQKEISVGRWTAEEHRVFLRGLEMYQGPAWGEIARMIGTRTSTQVRTHAQKFFTKLARTNQMLPYFEVQIQKERSRLIAQGAVTPSQSSVTPTATGSQSYTFNTLSPPRKRGVMSPNQGTTKREDSDTYPAPPLQYVGGVMAHPYASAHNEDTMESTQAIRPPSSTSFYGADHGASGDGYKAQSLSRYDAAEYPMPGLRTKPRITVDTGLATSMYRSSTDQAISPCPSLPSPMLGYSVSTPVHRDPGMYPSSLSGQSPAEWPHSSNPRQWPSVYHPETPTSAMTESSQGSAYGYQSASDLDALPSVNKLLFRGSTAA